MREKKQLSFQSTLPHVKIILGMPMRAFKIAIKPDQFKQLSLLSFKHSNADLPQDTPGAKSGVQLSEFTSEVCGLSFTVVWYLHEVSKLSSKTGKSRRSGVSEQVKQSELFNAVPGR